VRARARSAALAATVVALGTAPALAHPYGHQPGREAVRAALHWLGTPYSWGGGSAIGPTRGTTRHRHKWVVGFDCSGLVVNAYAAAGITLPHFTGAQYRIGRRIPFHRLRRGDLVFFGPHQEHVGIYIGGGYMVHAPHRLDVVRVSWIRAGPYRLAFSGAVRPYFVHHHRRRRRKVLTAAGRDPTGHAPTGNRTLAPLAWISHGGRVPPP
jgi:cell wall-associated NlpC family hydrolase